jgi:predicted metalloprotease with PDZ domain
MEPEQQQAKIHTDFSATVQLVLDNDPLIRVKPYAPQVDASGLVQLIRAMAKKIELQELELQRQREIVDSLQHTVATMRAQTEEHHVMRRDLKKLLNEVESLGVQQQLSSQRVERLRLQLDENAAPSPPPQAPLSDGTPAGLTPAQHRQLQSVISFAPSGEYVAQSTPTPQRSAPQSSPISAGRPLAGVELAETPHGLCVMSVKPNGPAELAGLRPNDIVLRVDGEDVFTKSDFIRVLDTRAPSQTLEVSFRRDGVPSRTRMVLAAQRR